MCVRSSLESEVRPIAAVDFSADPEVVRVVVDADWPGHGHLFRPAPATEIFLVKVCAPRSA
jgi:hypothetical protein